MQASTPLPGDVASLSFTCMRVRISHAVERWPQAAQPRLAGDEHFASLSDVQSTPRHNIRDFLRQASVLFGADDTPYLTTKVYLGLAVHLPT